VHFERYAAGDWTGQKHGAKVIGPLLVGQAGIQPTFLVHSKDYARLQALTREVGVSWSDDGGATWTQVARGPVETSKGLHAVSLASGWHFLAFNPQGRTPLSLARTRDGRQWETILPDLSRNGNRQVDYPTLMQSRDGRMHVVFSWGRSNIKHLVLDTEYLSGQP
jgi:alpha-L-rhamnosidase